MKSRREFLRLIISTLACLGIGNKKVFASDERLNIQLMGSNQWWLRNIFCQFDNERLKQAIEDCAKEIDCTISYGDKGSIDIFAIGSFVKIVDRNIVGHDVWKEYIECIVDSAGGDTPCIIVDDIYNLPLPKCQYICQLNLKNPTNIQKIIKTIKQMRKIMDKNVPDIFAKHIMEAS